MNQMLNGKLFESIRDTVERIDKELLELDNKGVFFAPELYIAFEIGKDVVRKKIEIFGSKDVSWKREVKLGVSGPVDIVFQQDGIDTAIELKVASKGPLYADDLAKLGQFGPDVRKYFCVLIDSLEGRKDGRVDQLDSLKGAEVELVGEHSFPTWSGRYKGQVVCNIRLYQLGG